MKRLVALLMLFAVSAMLFACGASALPETGQSQVSTVASAMPETPKADLATPYADIDFFGGEIKDNKGVVSLEIKNGGVAENAYIATVPINFMGKQKKLPVLCIKKSGSWVKGVFSEFENNTEFDAFVADNGGFSIEVFYLDKSTTNANRGIVCSTESIGGDNKRSGWGIAENAGGAPYFITGHSAENAYSSVYASSLPDEEPIHVVGVYNAATRRNAIYVNGSLVSLDSAAGAFTSADKTDVYEGFNMANVFYIGADPSGLPGKAERCDFPTNDLAVIDVKFYACALTEGEVKAAFAESASVFE